jgi:hypothetical protein
MPHEHEIPAPVTTMIFLHFATESERSLRALRVDASEPASKSRVCTILVSDVDSKNRGGVRRCCEHKRHYGFQVEKDGCFRLRHFLYFRPVSHSSEPNKRVAPASDT